MNKGIQKVICGVFMEFGDCSIVYFTKDMQSESEICSKNQFYLKF